MLDGPASESARVRILMPDEYNKHAWSFFSHHRGSSWHGKDARLIFWVGSSSTLSTAPPFSAPANADSHFRWEVTGCSSQPSDSWLLALSVSPSGGSTAASFFSEHENAKTEAPLLLVSASLNHPYGVEQMANNSMS